MKYTLKYFVIVLFVFICNGINAAILPPASTGPIANPTINTVYTVQDPYLSSYVGAWYNSFTNVDVKNKVVFKINRGENRHIKNSGDITINFTVAYQKYTSNSSVLSSFSETKEVVLNYDTGYMAKEKDQVTIVFPDAVSSSVTVNSVLYSLGVSYSAPAGHPGILLENIIDIERVEKMNMAYTISNYQIKEVNPNLSNRGQHLRFSWNTLPSWVEAVELEYAFVNYSTYGNVYGTGSYGFTQNQVNPSNCPINFVNGSTRVFLEGQMTTYEIPNLFPDGYIIYRIRPVGKNFKNVNEWRQGLWTRNDEVVVNLNSEVSAGRAIKTTAVSKTWNNNYESKNSVSSFTFAEGGRVASSVTYFDGTLRGRQSVAYSRASKTYSISQTIFDFAGRQSIVLIPTIALDDSGYTFRENFVISDKTKTAYNYTDFDLNKSGSDEITVNRLDPNCGASKFYSPNLMTWLNSNTTLDEADKQMHAFIPDAEGYSFAQTEYTRDPTGRSIRTGGVGKVLQLKAWDQNNALQGGHEVYSWDGTPFQAELDVLFGNEVGYAQKYKKVMTQDQNKQISVAYIDPYGRTVATALAGDADTSILDALESSSHSLSYYFSLPNSFEDPKTGEKTISHSFLVTQKDTWKFEYNYEIPSFNIPCDTNLCFTCGYTLTLSLKDKIGKELLPNSVPSNQFVGNPLPSKGTCNSSQKFSITPNPLTLILEPGEYTLVKTLRIDEDVKAKFKQAWLDSAKCLKSYDDFLSEEKAKMGLNCDMNCEQCRVEQLKLYNDIDSIVDYCVVHTIDTATYEPLWSAKQIYSEVKEICSNICLDKTPCDILYDAILSDLSPGGQYAKYAIAGWDGNDSAVVPVGKLSEGSIFQLADPKWWCNQTWSNSVDYDYGKEVWRQPYNIGKTGSLKYVFLDEVGQEAFIEVKNGIPAASAYVSKNGVTYARPHQLIDYNDYIKYYNPEWAKSLLYFHPEYCYYRKCRDINESYVYDNLLINTQTAGEAIKKGFYNPLAMTFLSTDTVKYSGITKSINYSSYEGSSPLRDPVLGYAFLNVNNLKTRLRSIPLNCTTTTVKSFWQLYERQRLAYGLNAVDTCSDNLFWPLLRAHYLQQKREWLTTYYNDSCKLGVICGKEVGGIRIRHFLINSTQDIAWTENDISYVADKNKFKFEDGCYPTQLEEKIDEQIASMCQQRCEANVETWLLKLASCPSIQNLDATELQTLRGDLQKLCESGCDLNNPYGAVTRNPLVNTTFYPFTNLADVLKKNLGEDWFVKGICDDLLIDFPLEYGHDYLATEDPDADTCACNGKKEVPQSRRCPETEYDSLKLNDCACDKNAPLKQELLVGKPIEDKYKCQNCISCDDMQEPVRQFLLKYQPEQHADSAVYQKLLQTWLNRHFKFNLTYEEYENYAYQCLDTFTKHSWVSIWNNVGINRSVASNGFNIFDLISDTSIKVELVNNQDYEHSNTDFQNYYSFNERPKYPQYLMSSSDGALLSMDIQISASVQEVKNIACACEKVLNVYKLLQGPPVSGNTATQLYNQLYGTPPSCLNPIADINTFCSQLWNMNSASTSEPIGHHEGDKFNATQINYIDNQVQNSTSSFINCLKDYSCTELPEKQTEQSYIDTCGCNMLKLLHNQWLLAGGKSGTGLEYKEYIYQQKGVNPDNPLDILNECDKYIKSDFDKDEDGNTSSWVLGHNYWSAISKENLDKFALNKNLRVPKSFNCTPSNTKDTVKVPINNNCIKLTDCNSMRLLMDQYLQDHPLPDGESSWSNYKYPGCGDNNPSLGAFDLLGNVTQMESEITKRENENFIFNQRLLIIGAGSGSSNPPYSQVGIDALKNWKDDFKSWFLALHKKCEPMPENVNFEYLMGFYSICKPQCYSSAKNTSPKCANCYELDTLWLKAFVKYNNQVKAKASNSGLNRLVESKWYLYSSKSPNLSNNISEFYNSIIYENRNNKQNLKYNIVDFKYPYIRLQIPDNNGYLLDYSMEYQGSSDWMNFGKITNFKNPRAVRQQNCDPVQYFYVDVEQEVDPKYWDNSTLPLGEEKCPDCPNYTNPSNGFQNCFKTFTLLVRVNTKNILNQVQCLSCAKLCNKPINRMQEFVHDECEQFELQTASQNAMMGYNNYLLNQSKLFDSLYTAKCFAAKDTLKIRYKAKQYHYTLYYYDRAGNLCKTVPPEGVDIDNVSLSQSDMQYLAQYRIDNAPKYRAQLNSARIYTYHSLITNYKYNASNSPLQEISPDGGLKKYWFDILGRIVLSQDDKQRNGQLNKYSYLNFDNLGRIVESGEFSPVNSINASHEMAAVKYSLASFMDVSSNPGNKHEVVRSFYEVVSNSSRLNSYSNVLGLNSRNRISTVTYELLNDNNNTTYDYSSNFAYDIHGNSKLNIQDIKSLDNLNVNLYTIEYDYDFLSGRTNAVSYQKGQSDQFYHKYYYDEDIRLTSVRVSRDGYNFETDAKYFYLLTGAFGRTELGQLLVQGIDNAYTLSGSLKGINSGTLNSIHDMGRDGSTAGFPISGSSSNPHQFVARDAFGFNLKYFEGDYKSVSTQKAEPEIINSSFNSINRNLYNGNISQMGIALPEISSFWSGSNQSINHGNIYHYDQLNRITKHHVFTHLDLNNNNWPSTLTNGNSQYFENFKYDANGNITNINRNGNLSGTNQKMDGLSYNYEKVNYSVILGGRTIFLTKLISNKLYHVHDAIVTSLYSNDFDNSTNFNASNLTLNNNYTYDGNGNLISDITEQIQEIQWNSTGKIKAIVRVTGSTKPDIEYGYRSDGHRLFKLVKPKESNGALKQELSWVYTFYIRDLKGNVLATYEKRMESTTTANTYKENYKVSAWDIYGSSRLGALSEKNILKSSREFSQYGTTSNGSWVDRTYIGSAQLATMNSNIKTLTRGNKQFELCNHLGNVLVTIQDRKRSVDLNSDNSADYYMPYLRTVTNYYAFGNAMPGIGGSVKECSVSSSTATLKKFPYYHTFSNDSTSGFTPGSGARTVSNPTHNVLHLESIWSARPLANKSIFFKNGVTYDLKFNIAGFSVVSGYSHTVKVRILLPGSVLSYTYTATGNQTINFTSNTTGYVTVEISSQINGTGTYSINPYIDIDNFNLSWDSAYNITVNNCGTNLENYKYGFNGEDVAIETDVEGLYDLGARFYNSSLGRMFSIDPLSFEFPFWSPYTYSGNNPIWIIDYNGLGPTPSNVFKIDDKNGKKGVFGIARQILGENASERDVANLARSIIEANSLKGQDGKIKISINQELIIPGYSKDVNNKWVASSSNSSKSTYLSYYEELETKRVKLVIESVVISNKVDQCIVNFTADCNGIMAKMIENSKELGFVNSRISELFNPIFGPKNPAIELSNVDFCLLFPVEHLILKSLGGVAAGAIGLRAAYVSEVSGLASIASKMRSAGSSSEEIALYLHSLRRNLGVKYKSLTPNDLLEKIYARNLKKYGDKLGPSIDYLRQQGKSWDDIINSATRPGGKDLGF